MPMNRDARVEEIARIERGEPFARQEIRWKGNLELMGAYHIPVQYLVYNKYNGRILSRTKSLETQKRKIDAETEGGNELIEKLLFETNEPRNRQTEKNIRSHEQEKCGIVTKDGIVIDGNRRLMCLNRIVNNPKEADPEKFKYFKAIILPVKLEEEPDEIRKLETTFQMGEDKKLGYNPIEKYLKAQELRASGVSVKDIARWMNETEKEIDKYLRTMKTMDDYLKDCEYEGIYTQLDGREDFFLSLSKWLENFRGEESLKAFDGYKESDVDDLEQICYDYIRAVYGGDGKRFRKIADGHKENHFFGDKELWEKFRDYHVDNISPLKDEENPIDYNAKDLKNHLDDRDKKFTDNAKEHLEENINDCISDLYNKRIHDKPEKLIRKASSALNEINPNTKAQSFSEPETQKQLKQISDKVVDLLCKRNVTAILQQSLDCLKRVEGCIGGDGADDQREIVGNINRLSHTIKKELGG